MRTAEEYLIDEFEPDSQDCQTRREDLRITIVLNPSLEKFEAAINEARKQLIEEIANRTYIADDNFNPVITKEEILNIINELK